MKKSRNEKKTDFFDLILIFHVYSTLDHFECCHTFKNKTNFISNVFYLFISFYNNYWCISCPSFILTKKYTNNQPKEFKDTFILLSNIRSMLPVIMIYKEKYIDSFSFFQQISHSISRYESFYSSFVDILLLFCWFLDKYNYVLVEKVIKKKKRDFYTFCTSF